MLLSIPEINILCSLLFKAISKSSDTKKTKHSRTVTSTAQVCTEKGVPLELVNGKILQKMFVKKMKIKCICIYITE